MEYRLVAPTPAWEDAYIDCAADFAQNGGQGDAWTPYTGRLNGKTYAEWLAWLRMLQQNPPAGMVPGTLFLFVDAADRLLGFLDLRHRLNDNIAVIGGHIGYGLRPAARGRGLAPVMLRLGLEKARAVGVTRALLTCDKDNLPSARTITACGGVLENEVVSPESGKLMQRYWIDL